MLSDEEREKIVGGTKEPDSLNEEQCSKLRKKLSGFSKEELEKLFHTSFPDQEQPKLPVLMMYGFHGRLTDFRVHDEPHEKK